jgi:amino acid adenylation domain-containing protein
MQGDETGGKAGTTKADLIEGSVSSNAEQGPSSDVPLTMPASDDQRFPLSYMQEQLWLLARLTPDLPIDNLSFFFDTPRSLDMAVLKRSLQELVQRHEALRTTFVFEQGRPLQVIHSSVELDLPVVSLEALPVEEQEQEMRRLAEAQLRRPFDFEHGPLFRGLLVRRSGALYKLIFVVHHTVIDGFSAYNIFFPELISLYNAYAAGESSPLQPANLQMRHYAVWQRRRVLGNEMADHMRYWKRQLANLPSVIPLPTDRPRPVTPSNRASEHSQLLSTALIDTIRHLAREERSTLFTALLAAFFVLLYRYTDQEDVFVGTVVADRNTTNKRSILGPLINMVVLRANVHGSLTFRQMIRTVREVLAAARDHSDLPFEMLVNELRPRRIPSQNPLFQIAFNYPHASQSNEWSITHRGAAIGTTNIDLIFELQSAPEGTYIHAQYSADLFDASTIERMLQRYKMLLRGAALDADSCVWTLPLLTDNEQKLLNDWNQASTPVPPIVSEGPRRSSAVGQGATFPEIFELQVERSPDATAVIFGEEELSYWELNIQANRLAHRLHAMGVGLESVVGIYLDRGIDMIVALLAILKAGGAYVPLDPTYPKERLAYMISDARPQVLITDERLASSLPAHQAGVLLVDKEAGSLDNLPGTNLPPLANAGSLAYIMYTSGSTGQPKGVLIEHRGMSNLAGAHSDIFGLGVESRVLQFSSICFDCSVWEIVMTFSSGATLVIGTLESIMPGAPLLSFLNEQRISFVLMPPSALNATAQAAGGPLKTELPALETVVAGAEVCPPDVVSYWAPGRTFFNAYGPTEITVCATMTECVAGSSKPLIGRPIRSTRCMLLDARMQPVAIGLPGELYIEGAGVARGYHNRPDLTADRFVPSMLTSGERMYRTGDLARYMPDGNLDFLGRVDRQIKIRGFRVEPGEIETLLRRRLEVREAVVLKVEEIEGDARLVAYVTLRVDKEKAAMTGVLRSYLGDLLPRYMVPSTFIILDELPRVPTGKVDMHALMAKRRGLDTGPAYVPPGNELEAFIADVWRRVLQVKEVGVLDNFFDLGGNSLLLARVYESLRTRIDKKFVMLQLLSFPTIRSLAQALSDVSAGDTSVVRAQDRARKQKLALRGQRQRVHATRRKP